MFQGFYKCTASMLCQTRNLNVISNNMANVLTPGFKRDQYTDTTFREYIVSRTGNIDKSASEQLGGMSMIKVADESITSFLDGVMQQTGNRLNMAISGEGFFAIQTDEGVRYTRNGSFSLDEQGYLCLPGYGRVIGEGGPIYLGTDRVNIDGSGNITDAETGDNLGRVTITAFADYGQLTKEADGLFTAAGQGVLSDAKIVQGYLEGSNVDPVQEMVDMMSSQRILQSSAQVLKSYDTLIGKMTSQLGPA